MFNKAIQYAKNIVETTNHEIILINHSGWSFQSHENKPLVNKEGNEDADISTGRNNGAEIYELVGLIMLSKLVHLFQNSSVGLSVYLKIFQVPKLKN